MYVSFETGILYVYRLDRGCKAQKIVWKLQKLVWKLRNSRNLCENSTLIVCTDTLSLKLPLLIFAESMTKPNFCSDPHECAFWSLLRRSSFATRPGLALIQTFPQRNIPTLTKINKWFYFHMSLEVRGYEEVKYPSLSEERTSGPRARAPLRVAQTGGYSERDNLSV